MKMALDDNSARNLISAYRPGRVSIGERHFTTSVLVFPAGRPVDWAPRSAADLCALHLDHVVARQCELLILGTGDTQIFPDPAHFAALMAAGIGYEVMDNAAACRTYNILLAEERNAALGLIMDSMD